MDTPFDSLASLNLDGTSGQTQEASQQPSDSIQPQTQASDPWSAIINAAPTSDANVQTAAASEGRQDLDGYCEKFVEDATYGQSGIYPTAVDAWNNYVKSGEAYQGDVSNAPAGTLIYYAPDASNNNEGHTGVSDGRGNMISATDNGVQLTSVSDWEQMTGQKPLGYVQP